MATTTLTLYFQTAAQSPSGQMASRQELSAEALRADTHSPLVGKAQNGRSRQLEATTNAVPPQEGLWFFVAQTLLTPSSLKWPSIPSSLSNLYKANLIRLAQV